MKKLVSFQRSMAVRSLVLATLVAGVVPSVHALIINPGFESGTTGWTESGGVGNFTAPSSLPGLFLTVNPAEGASFGLITNDGVDTETISQTFTLSAGPQFLTINYRFLTDEYNDPAFNDLAQAVLTPTVGAPITLFSVSRDDLQAGGAGPLLPGATFTDVQTIGQSAWHSSVTDVSAYAGQAVTLSFSVNNASDPDFLLSSRLAVDNIQVSAVPEPGAASVAVAALALVQIMRRVSKQRKNRGHLGGIYTPSPLS
ncbi:MAG: hypothetical protein PHC88_16620 [Terrimicrobiaceae bacterium]|nr:hypothetical protein [Terrimicrobiaceae bacterium]